MVRVIMYRCMILIPITRLQFAVHFANENNLSYCAGYQTE